MRQNKNKVDYCLISFTLWINHLQPDQSNCVFEYFVSSPHSLLFLPFTVSAAGDSVRVVGLWVDVAETYLPRPLTRVPHYADTRHAARSSRPATEPPCVRQSSVTTRDNSRGNKLFCNHFWNLLLSTYSMSSYKRLCTLCLCLWRIM